MKHKTKAVSQETLDHLLLDTEWLLEETEPPYIPPSVDGLTWVGNSDGESPEEAIADVSMHFEYDDLEFEAVPFEPVTGDVGELHIRYAVYVRWESETKE